MLGKNKRQDLRFSRYFSENTLLRKGIFFSLFFLLTVHCADESGGTDPSGLLALASAPPAKQESASTSPTEISAASTETPPSGGFAPPGQPENPPILNDFHLETTDPSFTEDPDKLNSKAMINGISFQMPVHNKTAVTAYRGKRNMYQAADGTIRNAIGFTTSTPELMNPIWFVFNQRADQKFKVIVVAKNDYGTSMKELDFSHNRSCVGITVLPATYGDCNHLCLEGRIIGNQVEFKSKFKHGIIEYLDISTAGFRPITGYDLPNGETLSYPGTLPAGEHSSKLTLDLTDPDNNYTCVDIKGDAFFTENNDYKQLFEFKRFRIE